MGGVPTMPRPTLGLVTCSWRGWLVCVAMVAMLTMVVRAHLLSLGCGSRALRWRSVGRGPIGRRGGGDGRGGRERRAFHDPIFLSF